MKDMAFQEAAHEHPTGGKDMPRHNEACSGSLSLAQPT
jgi:hypothetical protein